MPVPLKLAIRKVEPMTIVAGFNFDQGVLICADTKHSGTSKTYAPKISTKVYPSGARSAMAFSGRSRYARMAIDECERAIEQLSGPTIQDMADKVIDVLVAFHKKHVFDDPLRGYQGGPNFCLLLALWARENVRLYVTDETAMDIVHTFECMGTGESLGKYIINPRYAGPHMPLENVLFTAITALARIKKHDPDCGGKSTFVVLRRNGDLGYETDFDITQHEYFSDTFFKYATSLYTLMAERQLSDADVRRHIELFVTDVNNARGHLQTEKDHRQRLMDALLGSRDNAPKPSTPRKSKGRR